MVRSRSRSSSSSSSSSSSRSDSPPRNSKARSSSRRENLRTQPKSRRNTRWEEKARSPRSRSPRPRSPRSRSSRPRSHSSQDAIEDSPRYKKDKSPSNEHRSGFKKAAAPLNRDDRNSKPKNISSWGKGQDGPGSSKYTWGRQEDLMEKQGDDEQPKVVEKANFGLSGALAKDVSTGNTHNGVVMKWSEPPEARVPEKKWRLYVFKNDENIATLHIHRQSAYLFGRDKKVADVYIEHPSASKQHAVLQYRMFEKTSEDGLTTMLEVRPYIMDLKSTNGSFLNGMQIEDSRYIEMREKDVLTFGGSTREYVLISA